MEKDDWAERLDAAFKEKFGREVDTSYDLLGSMRFITSPTDGVPLTDEHHAFIRQWMAANVSAA